MEDYYLCAINFLKGSHLAMSPDRLAYRAPMYPLFLSVCIKLVPAAPLLAIRVVQSILGAFSAVLLFSLTIELTAPIRKRAVKPFLHHPCLLSFLTALIFAWFASQIFFNSVLMTETLFVFGLLAWATIGLYCNKTSPVWWLIAWSALLGILALIRPIAIFFVPIIVYKTFQCIPRTRWLRHTWGPSLAWLVPVIPWTVRNWLLFNAFVLISTNSGVNFFIGHNPAFGYYEGGYKEAVRQEYARRHGSSEVGEDRLFLRLGLQHIQHSPISVAGRSWWKFYFLYLLDKEPWPWEEYNQGEGLRFPGGIGWPLFSWNHLMFVLSLLGIVYAFVRKLPHGPILSILGCYTLACLIFFARTRFRIPLEPFLILYTVIGAVSLVETAVWGYGKFLRNFIRKGPSKT